MIATIKVCMLVLFIQSALCKYVEDDHSAAPNYTSDATKLLLAIYAMSDPDKSTIVRLMLTRSNAERQLIKKAYKKVYKEELIVAMEIRLSGDFQELVLGMMIPNNEFYARELHAAIAGMGTDEASITEILAPMNRSQVLKTNVIYKKIYGTALRDDLIDDTSEFFQELVVALADGLRPDETKLDPDAALLDAKALRDAVSAASYLRAHAFIVVFTTRSFAQLNIVFDQYTKFFKTDIRLDMKQYLSGDFLNGLLDIVNFVYSKNAFYAEKLENSMEGFGTNDKQLIRIIVGRSEIDLPEIRDIYKDIYGFPLVDRITDDTSGKYKYLLCALVKRNFTDE